MSDPGTARDARLEAYLDGALPDAERAAFEREIEADPSLGERVALQRRIDASLRRRFRPPEPAELVSPAAGAAPPGRLRVRPALAAAALVLAAVGAWFAWTSGAASGAPRTGPDDYYRALVDRGFRPTWVCTDDAQLREYTAERLGQALTVTPEPGTALVGWNYADGLLGDGADILLVKAGRTPVLVVIDEAEHDRALRTGRRSGLNVFRGTLGGLVMYEITPLDAPAVITHVHKAE